MQGVELVNRLINGEAETTIGMKYASTVDGRNAAVHERSHVAGSGDPKKSAEAAASASAASPQPDAPGGKQPRREPSWQSSTPTREPATPGESNTTKRAAASRSRPDEMPGERLVAAGKADGRDQPGDKTESHISEEELGITSRNDDEE